MHPKKRDSLQRAGRAQGPYEKLNRQESICPAIRTKGSGSQIELSTAGAMNCTIGRGDRNRATCRVPACEGSKQFVCRVAVRVLQFKLPYINHLPVKEKWAVVTLPRQLEEHGSREGYRRSRSLLDSSCEFVYPDPVAKDPVHGCNTIGCGAS